MDSETFGGNGTGGDGARPPRPRECQTVGEVIDLYLRHELKTLGAASAKDRERDLRRFAAACGHLSVAKARPFDLLDFLDGHPTWGGWQRYRYAQSVKRAFNWALDMELIQRNPFGRVRQPKGGRREPIAEDHLRMLMRAASPLFRRFLTFLKFTGCRPIEACSARWPDVHFDRGTIVLHEHKTAKKTGKPRIIPLVPAVVKLLIWMRRHRQVSTAELVERLLLPGPMKVPELAWRMKLYGVTHTAVLRARNALGVEKKWVGGAGVFGHYVYRLPPGYQRRDWSAEDHVFLNYDGEPWQRPALFLRMRRLKRKAGLAGVKSVNLYGLRHRWGLMGIKNKVNLKLLSLSMGHADTRTTEIYIDESGLADDVQAAAVQIAHGAGAKVVMPTPPPERLIPGVPGPPPAAEIVPQTEQIPAREGVPSRPAVPVLPAPVELAPNGAHLEAMMAAILQRLDQRPSQHGRRKPSGVAPDALTPTQEAAWRNYSWALAQEPALAAANDRAVYEWLKGRPDHPGRLPPLAETWGRYLGAARLFHGITKRPELNGRPTGQPPAPPPEEGAA